MMLDYFLDSVVPFFILKFLKNKERQYFLYFDFC